MAPDEQMNRKFVSELTALVRNIRAKITMRKMQGVTGRTSIPA